MRLWGITSQAKCAVLLMAALLASSACVSTQPPAPTLSESKASAAKRAQTEKGRPGATAATIDPAQIRALAKQAAPDNPAEQERLYRDFMEWSKARQKR